MKKIKGFTLVELIVAMAVFGILMTGIMRIAGPMSEASATNKVVNSQKMVENNIVSYLGENLRYATNLVVIEGSSSLSPIDAVKEFAKENPVDASGNPIFANPNSPTDAEMKKVRLICFDRSADYAYNNSNFRGRLIATISDRSDNTLNMSNLQQDGSANLYEVFGNAYYDHADYNLTAQIKDQKLLLSVDSDYFYTANKHGKFNDSSSNPVTGTYELRNATRSNGRVMKSIRHGDPSHDEYVASAGRTSTNRIYFVYLYPEKYTD